MVEQINTSNIAHFDSAGALLIELPFVVTSELLAYLISLGADKMELEMDCVYGKVLLRLWWNKV